MAPGTNSGSSKGSIANSTGTVPKMKSRKKISSRQNSQPLHQSQLQQLSLMSLLSAQRCNHESSARIQLQGPSNGSCMGSNQRVVYNNIPKNQVPLEWQLGELSSPRRSFFNHGAPSDFCDSDGSGSQDNRRCLVQSNIRDSVLELNGIANLQHTFQMPRLRMNGNDLGPSSVTSPSPSDSSPHRVVHNGGEACQSANSSPEHNLHQENVCLAPNDAKKMNVPSTPERMQVAMRLNQIQDYINQTTSLIEAFKLTNPAEKNDSNTEFLMGVLKDLNDSEGKLRYLLSAFDKLTEEEVSETGVDQSCRDVVEGETMCCVPACPETSVARTSSTVNQAGAVSRTSETGKQNDIKLRLEESMRKLHSLQQEQASLIQKRTQAQEELQEAHRARNYLMSISQARSSTSAGEFHGEVGPGADVEEQAWDGVVRNFQDQDECCPASFKVINRITNGDSHQYPPCKEHKIQDLQRKKQHMDLLTADMTASFKELSAEDEVKEQASSEDSAVEDALDECAEARAQVRLQGQIIRGKVAELNALRIQLEHAKSLTNAAQRRDTAAVVLEVDPTTVDHSSSDQAINIQRQKRTNGDGGSTPDQVDGNPGNLPSKQQQLDFERSNLRRLQEILATIQDLRSSGLPLPEHLINELESEALGTSPSHTVAQEEEEDAAVEADVEEDDEPESASIWNPQQQISLTDSAVMASELSRGLEQRAAQLQVERDGLAAMQRQLDGLFSQLNPQLPPDAATAKPENMGASISDISLTSSFTSQHRTRQSLKGDDAAQKRLELFSEIQSKWQQLQDEIASDTSLNAKAAPFLAATLNVMNAVAAHVIPLYGSEDQALTPEMQSTPVRHAELPRQHSEEQSYQQQFQMSSAPSTLMRKKPSGASLTNERAIWSSSALEDSQTAETSVDAFRHGSTLRGDDNPPIISMPTPSPNFAQQSALEMQSRLTALSQSCQSLYSASSVQQSMLPAVPSAAAAVPPPPPPGSASHDREAYYQQLLAAGQLQQQQVLLTAVNQCFHLLKIQQHELRNLSSTVHMLSAGGGLGAGLGAGLGVHPGAEQWTGHAIASPSAACPPTLNNQVPPGNRTNNYWDNFRSYSRQNLLSTSAKSNEGLSHSPSPLVERSHNALRSSTPVALPSAPPGPPAVSTAPPLVPPCLPAMGSVTGQAVSIGAEVSSAAEAGAVGPAPGPSPAMDCPLSAPPVQNISRKDKRNLEQYEGGIGSPHRPVCNEIDHRTATRALEDAALPVTSQPFSPAGEDFDVPPMPILRNPTAGLQSRLNHLNFNASSTVSLDSSEAPFARNQLNNEGVPFSEISSTLSNQHFNEFGVFCSVDQVRDTQSRHLNMDYNNATIEPDATSGAVHKRNTGAIKRTHIVVPSMSNNSSAFAPTNYQRNIHGSSATVHLSPSNSSSNSENANFTHKLSSIFASANGDSEAILKSSKHQLGQDCSRNFGIGNRRSVVMDEFQQPRSHGSLPRRPRMRDTDEADGHASFRRDVAPDYEDAPVLRGLGFISPSSASGPGLSNVEVHNFGPGKNQLKESCFQIRKCPKFQSKSGPRGQITDTTAAAAAAAAVVAVSSSSSTPTPHRTSSAKPQSGNRRRVAQKNNQGSPLLSSHGELYDEMRDAVYAEMSSLISANESRPNAVLQLFRDLQHIGAGPLRQTTLQLIQQAVNRYQADEMLSPHEREDEDDEECSSRSGACGGTSDKGNVLKNQEGDNLMQLVLGLELASVLSAHGDEICGPALVEEIRRRLLQLVPLPSTTTNAQASNATRAGIYLHSQINALLESVLVKFQGCRVGDVGREMTSDIVNSLPTRVMYHRMVDFYGRNNSEVEADLNKDIGSSPFRVVGGTSPVKTCSPAPHEYPHIAAHSHSGRQEGREAELITEASHGDLAEADQSHHLDAAEDDEAVEGDRDSEESISASGSESASALHVHVYQLSEALELDSEPEVEALHQESETVECNESDGASGSVLLSKETEDLSNSSLDLNSSHMNQAEQMNGAWASEQIDERERGDDREREEGLDQVPTRLACDSDRDQENGEKHRSHHQMTPPNGPSSPG